MCKKGCHIYEYKLEQFVGNHRLVCMAATDKNQERDVFLGYYITISRY